MIKVLSDGQVVFLEEESIYFYFDILSKTFGKKNLHIGDEKRYLTSGSYIASKSLSNHLKTIIDSM